MAGENGRHYELSGLAVPESLDAVSYTHLTLPTTERV